MERELPPPSSDPVKPVPRDRDYPWMSLDRWRARHESHVRAAAAGTAELVFLGDSITEMAEGSASWRAAFGHYRQVNFGIGGDRTQNILWRLENGEVGRLRPKLIVLLIGTNNIGTTNDDVGDTTRGVAAVVDKLRTCHPESKILVMGLFPRERMACAPIRKVISSINAKLAALDDDSRIFFRDIGGGLLDADGTLSETVSGDALHLTEEGYRRWAAAIGPLVAALMR